MGSLLWGEHPITFQPVTAVTFRGSNSNMTEQIRKDLKKLKADIDKQRNRLQKLHNHVEEFQAKTIAADADYKSRQRKTDPGRGPRAR